MNRGFTPAAPPPNLLYLKVIIFNCTYWRGANQIVITYPDRDIHVVLDNLNTHKPKEDRWLKRHSAFHSDVFLLVESSGMLVQYPGSAGVTGGEFHIAG